MGIICPCKLWKLSPDLEDIPERAAPTRYTCTPKSAKVLYKHNIIVLIFQGTQRKAYKYANASAGIEPTQSPKKRQKGRNLYALKITKILYIRRFCGSGTTRPNRNGCIICYCFPSSFPQAHRTATPQRWFCERCSTL